MKKIFPLIIVAFLLVSCSLPISITVNSQPTAVTQVATATPLPEQPLPTATSEMTGQALNLGGVSMTVPYCLASSASGVIVPEENPGENGPVFGYLPEYRKITLTGYLLTDSAWQPLVNVYPVARYVELVPNLSDTLTEMKQVLAQQPAQFANSIPLLPIQDAAQVFHARATYFDFQNGKGIGFLTEYAQYYAPVNNHDIFYTYQGLTNDGKYWVSITLPVNAAYLQPTYDNFTVPSDGFLPPQDMGSATFAADMQIYYTKMVEKLNSTSPDAFLPTLSCMQQFIQSLNIAD